MAKPAGPLLTVLLILGVPLVVTLAWFHGHKALHRVGRSELTIITMLLVIGAGVLWHFARAPDKSSTPKAQTTVATVHPVAEAPAKGSIAVLPFVDMSEKHDQEYFSDGLSEELIHHLAHYPDLKVIARTSSFAFKGKNRMRLIATKLGVANLLEGSVRKAGGELRITAQLIRALDGVHLWSEIYDRKLTDIFKVQDEISTTVAKALNVALMRTIPAACNRCREIQPISTRTTWCCREITSTGAAIPVIQPEPSNYSNGPLVWTPRTLWPGRSWREPMRIRGSRGTQCRECGSKNPGECGTGCGSGPEFRRSLLRSR